MLNFDFSDDEKWMIRTIEIARHNFTPYGCIIVDRKTNRHIEHANTVKQEGKTAHAEMNALRRLKDLKSHNVEDLILYTTGEPCPMCMGAMVWSGITTMRFGLSIEKISAYQNQIMISSNDIASNSWLDIDIRGGILEDRCKELFDKYGVKHKS